jgi:ribosome-binding protein aMBF1 (putative translation factor)
VVCVLEKGMEAITFEGLTMTTTRVRVSTMVENLGSGPNYSAWFGRNLRSARKNLRISQGELGERCFMGRTCVSRIERGGHGVTLATAQILANALGFDLKDLLTTPSKFKAFLGR